MEMDRKDFDLAATTHDYEMSMQLIRCYVQSLSMALLPLGLANFVVVKSSVFTSYCLPPKQTSLVSKQSPAQFSPDLYFHLYCSVLKCHSQSLGIKRTSARWGIDLRCFSLRASLNKQELFILTSDQKSPLSIRVFFFASKFKYEMNHK